MAAGTGVSSDLAVLSSTLNSFVQKNITPMVFDQVLKHNPVLYRFWRKGKVEDGGAALTWPVLTTTKQNGKWYTGAQQLPHGVEDTAAPAEVPWRHVAEDITIPRTDLLKARGAHSKIDLMKMKFDEAILNLRKRISAALYAQPSEQGGLDHLFQAVDDGANFANYAGISHTTTGADGSSYWKPGISGDGLINKASANITALTDLQTAYGRASDGDEQPTLGIFTQKGFDFMWGQLQALQRFTKDEEMTKAGFEAIKFNRAVVIVDRNLAATTTNTGDLLFLNENWIDLVSHEEENFAIDPIIPATVSERSINTKCVWSGNLRVKVVRYHSHAYGILNF